ncbi:MAG: hypothetical protein ACP5D1_08965 [Bacteroidales bacterium]
MKTIRSLILVLVLAAVQSCGPEEGSIKQHPAEIHHIGSSYFNVFHLCEGTCGKIIKDQPGENASAKQRRPEYIMPSRI